MPRNVTLDLDDLDDDLREALEQQYPDLTDQGQQRGNARRGYEERTRRNGRQNDDDDAAENARLKRDLEIERLLPQLNATGPIRAFLSGYKGDLTADAVRDALAKDPEWKSAVTLPPDPRDEAAGEQNRNAAATRGAAPAGGTEIKEPVAPGLDRIRRAYDQADKTKAPAGAAT